MRQSPRAATNAANAKTRFKWGNGGGDAEPVPLFARKTTKNRSYLWGPLRTVNFLLSPTAGSESGISRKVQELKIKTNNKEEKERKKEEEKGGKEEACTRVLQGAGSATNARGGAMVFCARSTRVSTRGLRGKTLHTSLFSAAS